MDGFERWRLHRPADLREGPWFLLRQRHEIKIRRDIGHYLFHDRHPAFEFRLTGAILASGIWLHSKVFPMLRNVEGTNVPPGIGGLREHIPDWRSPRRHGFAGISQTSDCVRVEDTGQIGSCCS